MEPAQGICISPIRHDRVVAEASFASVSFSVDNCDSSVGNPTMVPFVVRNYNRQSIIASIIPRTTETREQFISSCSPSTSRMASLIGSLSRYSSFTASSKTALGCIESQDRKENLLFSFGKVDLLLSCTTSQKAFSVFRFSFKLPGQPV